MPYKDPRTGATLYTEEEIRQSMSQAQPEPPTLAQQLTAPMASGVAGGGAAGATKNGLDAIGEMIFGPEGQSAAEPIAGAPHGVITSPSGEAVGTAAPGPWGLTFEGGPLGVGGTALPAAAVAAYYAPSVLEHGGNVLEAAIELDPSKIDSDSGLKSALLAGGPMSAWAVPPMDMLGIDISSGKHEDQHGRDAVREVMQSAGLVDDDYRYRFSDGTTFDMGKDGGEPYYNVGYGAQGYNPEWTGGGHEAEVSSFIDENYGDLVGAVNPLALALAGGDKKLASDFTGYFTNAISQTGGDANQKLREVRTRITSGSKDPRGHLGSTVWSSYNDGELTAGERNAMLAEIDKQYGVVNPNQGLGGEAEFGAGYIKPGEENKKK